ncbi:glycosyltransferase family 2 protein [Myroides indicus]|uniref:Glycosyltransferase involved in cell wall biosynthesis n=1 Tax=Myroides indicus TaxID=1323422 RepID=A0A4V3E9I5_9FLAO|nr:glycosyltransferase [Myroides indicus]TDS66242.1 glycosyltransferase involved in cell wall biosynthesis [Myroides indicus]
MLSVLIPVYNYDIFPLVTRLYDELITLTTDFEILVQDDCSHHHYNNNHINNLENCHYEINTQNIQLAKNRNLLIDKAKYDWVLLLDADVYPQKKDFIAHYLNSIPQHLFIQGGLLYKNQKPAENQLLRWKYGHSREAAIFSKRIKNPHGFISCMNILFNKKVIKIRFNPTITQYGFEDFLFYKDVKQSNINIHVIDNPIYHISGESSKLFLTKTKTAMTNLVNLLNKNILEKKDTKITRFYFFTESFKCTWAVELVDALLFNIITKNLLGKNPNLKLFDLYKLIIFHRNWTALQKRKTT